MSSWTLQLKLLPVLRNKNFLTLDDLSIVLDSLVTPHTNQALAQPEEQTSDKTNMLKYKQKATDTEGNILMEADGTSWTAHSRISMN